MVSCVACVNVCEPDIWFSLRRIADVSSALHAPQIMGFLLEPH